VAGADGMIRVHVPFFMTDFSQIERGLGSFSNDSASYIKEVKYLTQAYDMTWHETHLPRMESLFSILILFPNLSLIFEENLNRQRVALKPPREIFENGI
jgi:hypothetical protein